MKSLFPVRSSEDLSVDPLSEVLSLLQAKSVLSASLVTGGNWAIRFTAYQGFKFSALVRGACWLVVDGLAQPIRLETGDCYLLTEGRPYWLGSDRALAAVDAREVFVHALDGVARHGDKEDVFLIGGRFTFDEADVSLLRDALPPVIHVSAASDQAQVLRWVLQRLADELSAARAGASLMAAHLAHIMFVQVLRAHSVSGEQAPAGWLGALSDARIGAALGLMHAAPARRWTLSDLAQAVGMSRSAFALRFKTLVDASPLDYLLRWRMRLAAADLRNGNNSVSSIALALGYESESAFSNAFKRIMGCAPKHYRSAVRHRAQAGLPAA
jgi:AraC-like DNA-binding protein